MPSDCSSSSQCRRSAWMATVVLLLALADVLHLPSPSPSTHAARMTCEAYSSPRVFPLRRLETSHHHQLLRIDPLHSPRLTRRPSQPSARTEAATSETPIAISSYNWTKQNLAIALPAVMGLLADPVLSMVDTAFVGRLSSTSDLAALGVCTSIFHMAFSVFRGSTVATTSLVGNAKSKQEAQHVTQISLVLAGILGSLVLLLLRLRGPQILATMGVASSSPLYAPACSYLYARAWAAPAVVGSK
jgi:MatE